MFTNEQPPKSGRKGLTKLFLYGATTLTLASTAVVPLVGNSGIFNQVPIVSATELKNGTVIGQLNGQNVIRSTTNDMSSPAFQELVDSILSDKDVSNVKYIADTIQWNANSEVKGVNGSQVVSVSDFGRDVAYRFRVEGYENSDKGAVLERGQSLAVTNVGSVTNIETGEKIPVHLVVTYTHSVHGDDSQKTTNAYTAIKNQSGVITIGGATTTAGTATDPGGSIGEGPGGGGSTGGGSGTGLIGYIDEYEYRADIVRADNGAVIPDGELLMAIKVSDIDGNQRAYVGSQGVLGYIVSPDSNLTIGDGGLIASSSAAVNADTTNLSSTSYVALKAWSANAVNFRYTDDLHQHVIIVTGLFGNVGFTLDSTGSIEVVKTATLTGDKLWNGNYTLAGNKFRLTHKETGKTYEATTDATGKAIAEKLPFGTYVVEEVSASNGLINTFSKQEVTISLQTPKATVNGKQDQLVSVKGTNDEIVGQNTLEKSDNTTGKTAQGQAILKDAEYTLYYNDDSTGSAPHTKDTPVKWTDAPNAQLLAGEKVKTSIVNGKEVDNGDNIVLKLDPAELKVAVGNLALGKYYWKETNAPEGYAIDGTKREFEITKKDDVTKTIITENTKSLEQVIRAQISLQKIAQSDGNVSSSGINDVTFSVTPINDTKADAFEVTTGIQDGEDGYATIDLVYGDWKIEEKEAPAGYDKIKTVYVHMSYDATTDLYTITASHQEDGSKPFSKRIFSQSDDVAGDNPNAKGSVAGILSSDNFMISLSKQTYKDNETPPTPPSSTPPSSTPPSSTTPPSTPPTPKGKLPHTGELATTGLSIVGLFTLLGALEWKFGYLKGFLKKFKKQED